MNKNTHEIEKAKAIIIYEIVQYVPNSIVIKTIPKETTGNVHVVSLDIGDKMAKNVAPFDISDQTIDGQAEVNTDKKSNFLNAAQLSIIPAHTSNNIKANERFKIISTIIKSGYEQPLTPGIFKLKLQNKV